MVIRRTNVLIINVASRIAHPIIKLALRSASFNIPASEFFKKLNYSQNTILHNPALSHSQP